VIFDYEDFDLSGVRTYPLASRKSKARSEDFAKPIARGASVPDFVAALPSILGAADFKAVVAAIGAARSGDRGIVWGIGAHVLKTGLSPILVDLMERGYVSALAMNGAGVIHDFELALSGATSEDVDEALGPGRFGMAEETATLLNGAINDGVRDGLGLGQSVASALSRMQPAHAPLSVIAAAARLRVPVTVHVGIGTDIIHQHPTTNGAVLGEATYRDFQTFAAVCAKLEGGVVLNIGSAVIMPEVFLKALTIARNLGNKVERFTTTTFDMTRHYRAAENVQRRPTKLGGQGFYIIGHHEIMIPLLFAAITEELEA